MKNNLVNVIHFLTSNVNWNKKLCTGACLICTGARLIDMDSIWIPGLIYKLIYLEFPFYMILLLDNMINNKSFKVSKLRK